MNELRVNLAAGEGEIGGIINAAVLAPDAAAGGAPFDAFVKEVVREMTVKAGQKCTAIRRAMAPREYLDAVQQALSERLAKTKVGDRIHYKWSVKNSPQLVPEAGMDFSTEIPMLVVTTDASWQHFSQWWAQLTEPQYAFTPDGSLAMLACRPKKASGCGRPPGPGSRHGPLRSRPTRVSSHSKRGSLMRRI